MPMPFETTKPVWSAYLFFPLTLFFSVSIQALVELAFGYIHFNDAAIVIASAVLCCSFIWGMITFLSNFNLFSFNYKNRQIKYISLFILFNAVLFAGLNFAAITLIIGKNALAETVPCLITAVALTPWLYYYGKHRKATYNSFA